MDTPIVQETIGMIGNKPIRSVFKYAQEILLADGIKTKNAEVM